MGSLLIGKWLVNLGDVAQLKLLDEITSYLMCRFDTIIVMSICVQNVDYLSNRVVDNLAAAKRFEDAEKRV
jgi:hypothetical protein